MLAIENAEPRARFTRDENFVLDLQGKGRSVRDNVM